MVKIVRCHLRDEGEDTSFLDFHGVLDPGECVLHFHGVLDPGECVLHRQGGDGDYKIYRRAADSGGEKARDGKYSGKSRKGVR